MDGEKAVGNSSSINQKGVKIVASELKPCVFWFNVPNMEKSGTQMVIKLNLKFFVVCL